jgi:hypothetical protein
VGYYEFFEKGLDGAAQFHELWPEYICGVDRFGHFMQVSLSSSDCPDVKITRVSQGIRVEEIDTDGLLKLDEEHLLCLQVFQ